MRVDKVGIESKFPSAEDAELTAKFTELVEEKFKGCKVAGLTYLQAEVRPECVTSQPQGAAGMTKRETVMLPTFSGDERTAYLRYSMWRKQWMSHIVDYKERYRATMLLNHLDSKASERIIGLESDSDRAMASLDRYYNNRSRIIATCMR